MSYVIRNGKPHIYNPIIGDLVEVQTPINLPSITLAPGALDDVPLVPLIRFLADHGLELRGLTIEKQDEAA